MLFSLKGNLSDRPSCTLLVNRMEIEQVENFKFLGIWNDYHLTWEYNIQMLLNTLSQN